MEVVRQTLAQPGGPSIRPADMDYFIAWRVNNINALFLGNVVYPSLLWKSMSSRMDKIRKVRSH